MQRDDALFKSQTLSADDVEPGTPELAYMAARRMRVLWSARSHDLDGWRAAIEWMTPAGKPKAWQVLPSPDKPYGTARAFIEAEVHPDFDRLYFYVNEMLGSEWAKRIADNHADRPGPKEGTVNNPSGNNQYVKQDNPYAHKDYPSGSKYGTRASYLLERLSPEDAAEIGEGRKYRSVYEAARKTGIIKDRGQRLCMYADDPEAAGRYLAERVDKDWLMACFDAFMKATE